MAEPGGVGAVCTEFVRVTDAKVSRRRFRREIDPIAGVALSVQVMGNDKRRMGEATAIASAAGATIVDVNLGCPTPRAVRGGVGAAMLRDLDLLGEVLATMRERTGHARLSAKIRAGFDDGGRAAAATTAAGSPTGGSSVACARPSPCPWSATGTCGTRPTPCDCSARPGATAS